MKPGAAMKLEEFTPCLRCRRPVGEVHPLQFYRLSIEQMVFDHQAIQMTAGLSLQLRSPALVNVFNPTPELAKPLGEPDTFLLCLNCATSSYPIAALLELVADRLAHDTGDGNTTVAATTPAEAAPDDPPPGEAA